MPTKARLALAAAMTIVMRPAKRDELLTSCPTAATSTISDGR